jgi:molybdopterin-guanine dinucleotide biosynthesis protein A
VKINNIIAAILAGGVARRLGGIAKGALILKKQVKIIDNIIKELQKSDIKNIVISVSKNSNLYRDSCLKIIKDQRVNCGPLAGVESVLQNLQQQCDAVLFLPCDLPNITNKEIKILIKKYIKSNRSVVFAKVNSDFHPLCSIIKTSELIKVSQALDSGNYKIMDLWNKLSSSPVEFTNPDAFVNINTFDDVLKTQLIIKN